MEQGGFTPVTLFSFEIHTLPNHTILKHMPPGHNKSSTLLMATYISLQVDL